MRARIEEIVFDCSDPARLVRFWAALLDAEPVDRSPDWSYIDPPGFARIAFQRVPEGKAAKNRLHLDLNGGDVAAATAEAEALGARRVGEVVTDAYGDFQVLRDPEGNEFCFVSG
ncbi:VOC family protein [Streptomyces indicus]|uniref:Glyoxalase/Bleomycin resistance protein/Dioxygenase superfamily protein n=1 Tax=Streptomyces indicus TaxID=417292 RepID=A0A1G8ZYP0_9ACTN|nr:VOC family protein [Streptomyces indicus]SDK20252.1 Glyoxalase/Bleomycin resistance protein/Dioxygenase superfamily protein [Streptomyces indicus]